MNQPLYFDYAAATPMDDRVLEAMLPYFGHRFYNPSALYIASRSVKNDLDDARARIAKHLGCRASEIYYVAGGTEANNLAISGIMGQYQDANVIVSAVEHESILQPAGRYERRICPVKSNGIIDMEALEGLIDDKTVLISVMYANNEIGTIQPIREVTRLADKIRSLRRVSGDDARPLLVHTDACQAVNYLDIHVARLGVDMMSVNGGKIYGPKQSGVLYVRAGVRIEPQLLGGGQEGGLRSGTENVPAYIGLALAFDIVQTNKTTEQRRLKQLQDSFVRQLLQRVPDAVINGSLQHRLPNNVHVTFPGTDNERLLMELDERGIQCAVGSACSASNEEPSHVLKAIGLSDDATQSSLRFTMGRQTTEPMIDTCVEAIESVVDRCRRGTYKID